MKLQFDIGIWDASDNYAEAIALYLEKYSNGSYGDWKSNLGSSQLLIQLNGQTYAPHTSCFVEIMGRQFLQVHDRLKKGQDAFLKSNLIYAPEDYYLLFEHRGENIYVTEFFTRKQRLFVGDQADIPQEKISNRFPLLHWHPQKTKEEKSIVDDDFIHYILANKDAIKLKISKRKSPHSIYNLVFPTVFLLEALLRNGQLGVQANALTEVPLSFDYY